MIAHAYKSHAFAMIIVYFTISIEKQSSLNDSLHKLCACSISSSYAVTVCSNRYLLHVTLKLELSHVIDQNYNKLILDLCLFCEIAALFLHLHNYSSPVVKETEIVIKPEKNPRQTHISAHVI